ncbi:Histone deacetylase 8 [Perkinsus olseni]|uniref:histone deacetylase n=1 Tax=Perkinsus olseni TaxID=32597 RepID=A0A7J6M170_PEROL|nr:Histone deacetylase 8 [Perkinsus olseni]KAF4671921.1 Histone deacetylase 8 [Perkinsus olseni]
MGGSDTEAPRLPECTTNRFDTNRPVAYFTDIHHRTLGEGRYEIIEGSDIGAFKFAVGGCGDHPMDPERLRLTHSLIVNYGLLEAESPMNRLSLYSFEPATFDELAVFHDRRYLEFIRNPSEAERKKHAVDPFVKYNLSLLPWTDCTLFEGVFDYCCRTAGASLDAAQWLCDNTDNRPIAINWNGGMHHAHCANAAGFCYVNDIVLAIVKLLEVYERVLYVDIDYHHGDAVEEAFYSCPRVVTLSIHSAPSKSNAVSFPGTGAIYDIGPEGTPAKGHAVNLPMKPGLSDEMFLYALRTTLKTLVQRFRPSCLVVQSGSDSLAGDLLTSHSGFNLSTRGHATAVQELRRLGIPTLVLGGGGYSLTSVAKCWSMETAVWLNRGEPFLSAGAEETCIPSSDQYYVRYAACPSVHVKAQPDLKEHNTRDSVEHTVTTVLNNIKEYIPIAPSVPLGLNLPDVQDSKRRRRSSSLGEEPKGEPSPSRRTAPRKRTAIQGCLPVSKRGPTRSSGLGMRPWRPHWIILYLTASTAKGEDICRYHNTCDGCIASPACLWCPVSGACEAWPSGPRGPHDQGDGHKELPLDCEEDSSPCNGCISRGDDACRFCGAACPSATEAEQHGDSCAQWLHGTWPMPPPERCYDFYSNGIESFYMSAALRLPIGPSRALANGGNMTDELPVELELSGLALALVLLLPVVIPVTFVLVIYLVLKLYRRYRRQHDNPNDVHRTPKFVTRVEAKRLISRSSRTRIVPQDEDGVETCNVCIDSIEAGVAQRTLWCGHAFHDDCIKTWLLRPQRIRWRSTDDVELQTRWYDPARMSCPTCRKSVVDALGANEIFPRMIGQPRERSLRSLVTC